MRIEIPLFPETPLYDMTVTLDGVDFRLQFDWNGREDRWYLSIFDSTGAGIRRGLKVVPNWDLLGGCVALTRPEGKLFFLDSRTRGAQEAPNFYELGREVRLVYASGAELTELESLAGVL